MKKVIFLLALLLGIAPAQAGEISRVTSQRGVTQAQWEATDQYKFFVCPTGTGRGGGVDMNFTTDQSDDTWFATCNTIEVFAPRPMIDIPTVTIPVVAPRVDTPTVVTQKIDTPTVVTIITQSNTQPAPITPVVEIKTAIVETKTAIVEPITNVPTVTSLKTTTVQLSDVIWGLKNQVTEMKKLNAKILVRTKKK